MLKLMLSPACLTAEPLRKRVPVRDEQGRPLSDFMVLIPGLAKKSQSKIEATIRHIQTVVGKFDQIVAFSELNLKLSLLWVSLKPVPGARFKIAKALRASIPEARIVSFL